MLSKKNVRAHEDYMLKLSGYSLRQAAWGGNDSPGRFLVRTYFLAGTYPSEFESGNYR
ncbi:MAG: hypothetical protein RIF36_03470 [Imperialibacter sp.]|uniref:hypothetical protein n=1 Tax=Imperialibacter sp. TaxID=2038411 RepID=UPI0032EDE182